MRRPAVQLEVVMTATVAAVLERKAAAEMVAAAIGIAGFEVDSL